MPAYALRATLDTGFADAVERTRAALAEQGFGVLTEIDVAATMKAKLDQQMAPHLILGACNPHLAHQALLAEPSSGLLLPCNVVLRSVDQTRTMVEVMDPAVMVTVTGNPALAGVAEQARNGLQSALTALTATQTVS